MTADPFADPRRHAVDLDALAPSTPASSRRPSAAERAAAKRAGRAAALAELAVIRGRMAAALPNLLALARAYPAAAEQRRPGMPWVHTSGRRSLRAVRAIARRDARLSEEYRAVAARAERLRTCDAKCRDGHPCGAPGIGRGGRCKLHGGRSTGAVTPEGKAKASAGLRPWRPSGAAPKRARPEVDLPTRFAAAVGAVLALRPRPRKPRRSTWSPAESSRPTSSPTAHQPTEAPAVGSVAAAVARRRLDALADQRG